MKKKKSLFDIKLDLSDKDLQELFEPFTPREERRPEPIVLAHGIARLDFFIDTVVRTLNLSLYDFSLVSDRFHYFKGIASFLKKHGFEVFHSNVSFAADVSTRAKDLKKEVCRILRETGHERVHIIGHSMGGLDARHMIVKEGMEDRVASVTTIGTPHLGTVLADEAVKSGIDKILGSLGRFINLEGIRSLTSDACGAFNAFAESSEAGNDVTYQTFSSAQSREHVFAPLRKSWETIYEQQGENDGLVSVKSQRWTKQLKAGNGTVKKVKQFSFPEPADHLDQIGWWNLNEIHKAGWWDLKALLGMSRHEATIKGVYLKIAEMVRADS